ncbi:hypothetical protein Y032_0009g491 [Ancylostoma ceylanicum]|uniref:Reverse transcriptase domain-containing protein n=1 Tax=Ancylostoma ceylanicum TaxID=53326 RepID=A0A016VJ79_9BILA|nr:hypothetical protein Y032_0009g491 [Ancylostoma ceylanicum]
MSNEEFPHSPISLAVTVLGPLPSIQEKEVASALAKMRSGRAPGPDNPPSKIWKIAEGGETQWLTSFFNEIIAEGKLPEQWTMNTTVPM